MQNRVLSAFRTRWSELAGFALLFRMVESLLFAPAAALVGKWLLGRTVLDSTAVVSFVLSPRGFLALALAVVTALSIRLIEHAGLSAIFFGAFEDRRVTSWQALHLVGSHLLTLVQVSARFVVIVLGVILPLLAVAGAFAASLLKRHDVNYYLKLHPPEFITAAVVIGGVALMTAVVMLLLIVRWRWVVQLVLFRQRSVSVAFSESAALTRGLTMKLLGVLIGLVLISVLLGLVASAAGGACASVVLALIGDNATSLAISFSLLLLLRTIIAAGCTFAGSCLDAGVFTWLFRQRVASVGSEATLTLVDKAAPIAVVRWLPVVLASGVTAFGLGGTWLALDAIPEERGVSIHAHRGVFTRAPENTLAAVREAISAGADYVETDVQLSKDGVLVIAHDSDFSRLGGVSKKVWDLTYDEIRVIPLGGRSAPEFRTEVTPTLDAFLDESKGRIKVNIELKYYGDHQPGLARKVVEAVRARGMLDQVVVQCLEYKPLLEVRELAPQVPIGYLLSFNARKPARLDVDFLSVEQNRLDRNFITGAHRRGQQVYGWTVNTAGAMERLLDLGIDGVITDQAALARKTLESYLTRPESERAVRRVRSWLAE